MSSALHRHQDPIVAIATAAGRGAVGIVRISGCDLAPYVQALLGRSLQPRHAHYVPFPDAQGQAIDQGLALFFPAPHSYTGQDVLELQAHGGPVVLQLLLARCLEVAQQPPAVVLPRLRLAEPGEFTQRAFLHGKIDLAQAEAIADLIDASTEAAARSAGRSLSGAFSQEVAHLRDALVHLRMLVEATLDFPEEDIDFLRQADAQGQLERLRQALHRVQAHTRQGALLREGITVVIAGQPNAGKSSLLNALAGAELALVTPIAGTTRDKVQQTIQIEGVPLHVIDTAGLRDSSDEVERLGIARAWQAIAQADAVLFLHDLTRAHSADYTSADAQIAHTLAQELPARVPVLHVWNKSDVPNAADTDTHTHTHGVHDATAESPTLSISAHTGAGLQALRCKLLQLAGWHSNTEGSYIARERHIRALHQVQAHLTHASEQLHSPHAPLDLLAEELRLAHHALCSITGEFGAEDLLGVIFSQFCIGK